MTSVVVLGHIGGSSSNASIDGACARRSGSSPPESDGDDEEHRQ
jgi:hypothetical protein